MGIGSECESTPEADKRMLRFRPAVPEAEARAADEGPHVVGIGSECESTPEADKRLL